MRVFQAASLITIIGLTSNFVSELVSERYSVPSAFIGTLVVACLTALYVGISYILFWDHMLPLLIATAADGLCFVAATIVACVIGKPVSYLACDQTPREGNTATFLYSLFLDVEQRHPSGANQWADPGRASCVELKALWGLSIATSITFFVSAIAAICLWKHIKGGSGSGSADARGEDSDPYHYKIPDFE
ncbi:hypothetical protein ESCO_002413 [Escovopsis weberi]|uniref:MARVEL domain-containing protein n=1 Tax=Escovopsis weberi TaxID=150374 RepID=A0A0N0RSZ7_ESCWE|nr:hypothetical protein ESCO_002413 [Escovopsis weberi]